jgi:TPR repeat protein
MRPRLQSGAYARPLNFTVRRLVSLPLHAFLVTLAIAAVPAFAAEDHCHAGYWDGTKRDAIARCEADAKAGDAHAQFGFALILWSGHDRHPDHRAALDWFRLSARQGNLLAQVFLGHVLSDREVEADLRNPVEAYAWFIAAGETKAAAKLRATLSASDGRSADQLASEYRMKYGEKRHASGA